VVPLISTFTPGAGEPSSDDVTVPEITLSCPNTGADKNTRKTNDRSKVLFIK
jgi:hypothetical protein